MSMRNGKRDPNGTTAEDEKAKRIPSLRNPIITGCKALSLIMPTPKDAARRDVLLSKASN
jgi:hypothetical protein